MASWLLCVIISILVGTTSLAHEGGTATLADVHKILLKAAGYQSDTPPTPAEQTQLLNKALEMLQKVPHVYHGELQKAAMSIEAALNELSTGDTAHKAKGDIYDADDAIKSVM